MHGKYVERGSSGFCSRCIWYLNIRISLRYLEHLQCRPSQRHCSVLARTGWTPFKVCSQRQPLVIAFMYLECFLACMETILIHLIQSFLQRKKDTVANYVARLHMQLGSQTSAFFTCNFSFFTMPWPSRHNGFFHVFFAPFLVDCQDICGNVGKFHFTKFSGRWMGVCAIYFHTRIEW